MNISAWEIYWVLQLDSISAALSFLSAGGIMIAVALTIWNGLSRLDTSEFPLLCNEDERKAAWASRAAIRRTLLAISLPLFAINAFVPSSKTMAAVIVVPAIANNDAIKREAGELYQLAKEALREVVKPDAKQGTD